MICENVIRCCELQSLSLYTDGSISCKSILLAQSVLHELQGQSCSPTDLFYQGHGRSIREWLAVAISRALHQGEDSLLELTKQICCFLQVQTLTSLSMLNNKRKLNLYFHIAIGFDKSMCNTSYTNNTNNNLLVGN